ncbi:MAG: tetrahydromethanopterin S-methyltransferase subunit F [Methanomicrobiales archaeon]|nr:tetrahydromethanopterin S-methyltransferase subunit F [Methanomicrobiales archaeon]
MSEEKKSGPIRMAAIEAMVSDMKYKGQILARTNKLESGIMNSGMIGFSIGLAFALVLVVPVVLLGGF